jgi:SAM-dependent methyltransferase
MLLPKNHPSFDRKMIIEHKTKILRTFLPELFEKQGLNCLEVGCREGIMLEILECLGHAALGVESPNSPYIPMHKSQQVVVHYFWAQHPPYPYVDNRFDFSMSINTLKYYTPSYCWDRIIREMCRVSDQTVLILTQPDEVFAKNQKYIPTDIHGWEVENILSGCYKYSKVQPATCS